MHTGLKWNVSRLRFSRQNIGWLQTELGTLKSRQCPDSKVISISRCNVDCLQGILSRYIFHCLQPKQSGGSLKKAKNVILNSRFPERGQTNFVCTRSGKRLFLRTSGKLIGKQHIPDMLMYMTETKAFASDMKSKCIAKGIQNYTVHYTRYRTHLTS